MESNIPLWKRKSIEGKAYAHSGNLIKAQNSYLEALEIEENSEILVEYGLLLIAMNQPTTALKYLLQVYKDEPENIKLRLAMGQAYIQLGDARKSYEHLHYAFSNSYDYPEVLNLFVQVCEYLGYTTEAESILKQFMDFYPGEVSITLIYSRFLSRRGTKTIGKSSELIYGRDQDI